MKRKIKGFILNLIKQIKKYIFKNILFLTYLILSVSISCFLRFITVGHTFDLKPLLSDVALILIIGSLGYLFKPKNRFKYYFFLIIFFTFLGIANSLYYKFYVSFVSVEMISTLKMLGEVGDSVTTKLEIKYFVFLLAPIILVVVNSILKHKKYFLRFEKSKKMYKRTLLTGLTTLAIIIVTLTGTEISRFVKQWNREYIIERFGLYMYTINDVVQSIQPKVSTLFGYDKSVRTFREFYENKEQITEKNKYTNMFKGKNILFIHAESIQNFLIDLEVNDIEITPNLNKLKKEGMYFSNFYPQISIGTSSDTEFTLLTGLMPSTSGTVFVNYYNRTYESIPKKFKELGYYTFSMHGNNGDYWNRNVMHKSLGYDRFYAKDTFDVNEETVIGLGINDKEFLAQAIEKIKVIETENERYMGTIITLTNHSPFNDVDKYGDLDFSVTLKTADENGEIIEKIDPYLEDTDMGNYLKSAHYADEALGDFFQLLKENNLDEDLVVVIYGDHEAKLGKKAFDMLYNYDVNIGDIKSETDPTYVKIDNYSYDLLKNTPLIIWSGDKKLNKQLDEVMGMYDVFPTIGNMFGFSVKYALGNDYFSKNEKIVIFPNGNFLTNKIYYNSTRNEYISLNNDPIEDDYVDKYKKYSEERLEVSKSIILHNLIEKESSGL